MRLLLRQTVSTWAVLGGIILISIVVVTSTNVGAFAIDRLARLFGTHFPALPGFEDYVRLAISSAALMFFPYCQQRRGHIVVDLMGSKIPTRVKQGLDTVWLLMTILLALFLAYWMTLGMFETRQDNALSRVLGWPEWPFYVPGIVSLILWALVSVNQVLTPSAQTDD